MKAILKYDYVFTEKDDADIDLEFYKNTIYQIVHRQYSNQFVGGEFIVIINDEGYSMSVSSHPDYVTLIDDEQELIDKLRWDGYVDINKQGE